MDAPFSRQSSRISYDHCNALTPNRASDNLEVEYSVIDNDLGTLYGIAVCA